MYDLSWLVRYRFRSLIRREYDWHIFLDNETSLTISCLWRLLEGGRICRTSEDDGHRFGLPGPVDAAEEVNSRLGGTSIEAIEVRQGTLDLSLQFSSGHILELIPDSSGYEAWSLNRASVRYIAAGGGNLARFEASPEGGGHDMKNTGQ